VITDPTQNTKDHFMMSAVRCSILVSRRAKPSSRSFSIRLNRASIWPNRASIWLSRASISANRVWILASNSPRRDSNRATLISCSSRNSLRWVSTRCIQPIISPAASSPSAL
jgi:hypothetical protein